MLMYDLNKDLSNSSLFSEMMSQFPKLYVFLTIVMVFTVSEGNCLFDWLFGSGDKNDVKDYNFLMAQFSNRILELSC